MQQYPMTAKGAELLKEEIQRLKQVERPKITKAIATARELGDLSENAEYKAAREAQSFCEGKIQELTIKLAQAHIIDVDILPAMSSNVKFGYIVELEKEETGEIIKYQIVGEHEADLNHNKLSVLSPLARALMGKEVGKDVTLKAPSGEQIYTIMSVRSPTKESL